MTCSYKSELKRHEEALTACEQAIRLDPSLAPAFYDKGLALNNLNRYEEALTACEQAIHLNPNDADAYNEKGNVLLALARWEESRQAFDTARQLGYDYDASTN